MNPTVNFLLSLATLLLVLILVYSLIFAAVYFVRKIWLHFRRKTNQQNIINNPSQRIEELENALNMLIKTQEDWETAVEAIIGRQPKVFPRAIDEAKRILHKGE